jgi:hypothetical protein
VAAAGRAATGSSRGRSAGWRTGGCRTCGKDPAKAILKGDENTRSVIVAGIKTKMQEFLPHSGD